jgi:hypothetical protein
LAPVAAVLVSVAGLVALVVDLVVLVLLATIIWGYEGSSNRRPPGS